MVGDLAAALDLDHRDVSRRQQMLGLAGLALGEHLGMLQQPDFVGRPFVALASQATHRLQGRQVVHQPQMTHDEFGRCH
ncbi:hypothetical protein D9M71_713040 [compost metagenome]